MKFKYQIEIDMPFEKGDSIYFFKVSRPTLNPKTNLLESHTEIVSGTIAYWKIIVYPNTDSKLVYYVNDQPEGSWYERYPDELFETKEKAKKEIRRIKNE